MTRDLRPQTSEDLAMLKLARWSTSHRKYVLIGWIALLVVVNVIAQSAGSWRGGKPEVATDRAEG
jgi:hypothetical protein